MLRVDIPGRRAYALQNLVLDVNGTIAEGGAALPGLADALASLRDTLTIVAVTADAHGTAASLGAELGIEVRVISPGGEADQKLAVIESLGADATVAIGNGANDALMLAAAGIGIAVVGPEGAARIALEAADVVVTDVRHALAMLADPARLAATLRV
jgi:P-type E1-E2 ATPase